MWNWRAKLNIKQSVTTWKAAKERKLCNPKKKKRIVNAFVKSRSELGNNVLWGWWFELESGRTENQPLCKISLVSLACGHMLNWHYGCGLGFCWVDFCEHQQKNEKKVTFFIIPTILAQCEMQWKGFKWKPFKVSRNFFDSIFFRFSLSVKLWFIFTTLWSLNCRENFLHENFSIEKKRNFMSGKREISILNETFYDSHLFYALECKCCAKKKVIIKWTKFAIFNSKISSLISNFFFLPDCAIFMIKLQLSYIVLHIVCW